ncbi:hypothetical protein [Rhodopirellula sp. P2]|uniref:hypothetical protein n=1 Tax=Rhodopirellula sp. P2 TaxID=2127060 RepID=UPI0023682CC4|nr:hypothetical protein [Rhodopirellula sp. P2]WDQ17772.1 hypothetical protein PSR62_04280 [Rhodopirellula sp. P2]
MKSISLSSSQNVMWFQQLTGISEESPAQVRQQLSIDGDCIVCSDGKRIAFGRLETPKLSELRQAVFDLKVEPQHSTLNEIVGDACGLHARPANENAMFQVASQFNLLEMTSPSVTPEHGIEIYESDPTQGPACAIACGAGTIYRNYFAPVGKSIGQSAAVQIDCSSDLGKRLGNVGCRLWEMQNGYLFPTNDGLNEITTKLHQASEDELNELRGELRIGLQWQTEVTLRGAKHRVSQAYCSALPVAYDRQFPKRSADQWANFAKLVLDAAYEATLAAAVINMQNSGSRAVYLTLLGGGVFGNQEKWILAAIERAFHQHSRHGLDIQIVSYRQSHPAVAELVRRINASSMST